MLFLRAVEWCSQSVNMYMRWVGFALCVKVHVWLLDKRLFRTNTLMLWSAANLAWRWETGWSIKQGTLQCHWGQHAKWLSCSPNPWANHCQLTPAQSWHALDLVPPRSYWTRRDFSRLSTYPRQLNQLALAAICFISCQNSLPLAELSGIFW